MLARLVSKGARHNMAASMERECSGKFQAMFSLNTLIQD